MRRDVPVKQSTPVLRMANGRYRIDVLAVREAIENDTLSKEDEAAVEKLLPGICSRIRRTLEEKRKHADPKRES